MRLHESLFCLVSLALATCASVLAMPSPEGEGLADLTPRGHNYGEPNPCADAENPSVNASMQLKAWTECAVNGFFPYPANGAWDKEFARAFSKDLRATFNATTYGYDTWLSLYKTFNNSLIVFTPFRHGFTSVIAVPDSADARGGFVSLNGWEGGFHSLAKKDFWFSDTAFAVIEVDAKGKRKIVEFREATNMPSSGVLPQGSDWVCKFTKPGLGGKRAV